MAIPALHGSWRDCKAWKDEGLDLSTTSNEACQWFDRLLTQWVTWCEDESAGGMNGTMNSITHADPNFILGQTAVTGIQLIGGATNVDYNPEMKSKVNSLVEMASKANITEREGKHVNAVKLWAEGKASEACQTWEDILLEYPTDLFAVKSVHHAYYSLGYQAQMRDSIARVIPLWKSETPLYGYLMGMYAFGLVETNFYNKAENVAQKGLEINRHDIWSTHALAHVMEMTGRPDEGIHMMISTLENWKPCNILTFHAFWHLALYYIEKGDYEEALTLYDNEIFPLSMKCESVVTTSSLLLRLEMEGVNVGDRWKHTYECSSKHTKDNGFAFNDFHVLAACLRSNEKNTAQELVENLQEFVKTKSAHHNCRVTANVGLNVCEALQAYESQDYATAVSLLEPTRYELVTMGASNAQRDVFNLLLINSALKSRQTKHHRLARQLLLERKAFREDSPMTDRLIAKALALHID